MIKVLYLEIDRCEGCPYCVWSYNYDSFLCKKLAKKELHEDLHMPDWCPLPQRRIENDESI